MGTEQLLVSLEDHNSAEFSRLTGPNIGSSLLQNHHLREYSVRRILLQTTKAQKTEY